MVSPGNIRLVLAIIVTTAIIGIVAVISMKGSKQAPPEQVSRQLPPNIDVALHDARFSEMRDGAVVWNLVAKRADYDKNGEKAYLSDIRMVFSQSRAGGAITVTARKGTYYSKRKDVRLEGDVRVETGSGAAFETDVLDYSAKQSRFRTASPVRFSHERITLEAVGMELFTATETCRFLKSVTASVVPGTSQ